MNAETLISLFERDLNKLIIEIELYKREEDIWRVEKNISNSAGNLALHLVGNLNTFIGKEIGRTNYVRNRELEFSQKNVPKKELIENINNTIQVVKDSLIKVTNEDLQKDYPILKFSETTTTEYLLVHLFAHLSYHLGQINYHRRLIDKLDCC
ncbi:DUF1572 domain-containing protein [Flavobacterium sp. LS1R49]|uniref:DUF1572 domain-containing protein n=1 Tax=Flavobacterium shii TaxID=2987687 RepID=A0A9X3C5E3_9FLAO|nr:DUF1572 domain-containing protein [Flavobacterium shii]MCV9930194.1 DUF1572 domain-containing protein [Flavobacterium shii]